MNISLTNRARLLALLLGVTVISYGFFELFATNPSISEPEQNELAHQALYTALDRYADFEKDFADNSRQFSERLYNLIEATDNPHDVFQELSKAWEFWGFSVFKDRELWLWSGFGEHSFPLDNLADTTQIDIGQANNVTFLRYQQAFEIQHADTTHQYLVVTRKKLQQNNILSIGRNSELDASALFQPPGNYPVHFSFFDDAPQSLQAHLPISTQHVDSAGIIYTLNDDINRYRQNLNNKDFIYRALFYGIIIILFTLFLITFSRTLDPWQSLFLKLFAITTAWLFFANLEYGVGWVELIQALGQHQLLNFRPLLKYSIHALFILLVSIACFRPLLNREIPVKPTSKLLFSVLLEVFGILSFSLLLFYLTETYELFIESSISVLDLEMFPNRSTFSFYLISGVFAIASAALLNILGWFLLKTSPLNALYSTLLIAVGFLAGVLLFVLTNIIPQANYWLLFTTSLFFGVIMIFVHITYRNPALFSYVSRLRILLLFAYITVCITYISVYKGYSVRLNAQMEAAVEAFLSEEEEQAETIARELLTHLEQSLSEITRQDFDERPAFVENRFIQYTQRFITANPYDFSVATQLVNNEGDILAEYSSDLDSPAWTRAFDMLSLVIPFEEERIRIENLRPIIRERPLNEANSNYSAFRRAWIPLYSNQNPLQRVGWILCSVYRERPQFEKPLRAVLASEESENWSASINITEYINGQAARNDVAGIPLELPGYSRLPAELMQEVNRDSLLFRRTSLSGQSTRELFVASGDQKIIRAATSHPGLEHHLFSVIRYFFSILFTGIVVLGAFSWKRDLNILGHNRRFRDRLIDRFILASLLCLMALTSVTYYAIQNQNQKNVESQLLDKLRNLTEAIHLQTGNPAENTVFELNQLTSALDADAGVYTNKTIQTSTTSQIYNQHLLPQIIPWQVHHSIYELGNKQVTRRITLGNQELLIGYQPIESDEGRIEGIVAIPTFLEAPKFNEQLLSTTSYLLGLYVLIFGLFIFGAALISTQLTSPLEALREGLKKISGGDLETTLPVHSKDEIGSLTNAYNVMVYRLKDLQDELARAEREAAWKEMAQQVAHEIKNPLTPMKLNLQHLERQLKASPDNFEEIRPKIEKIAANMIDQIDSLNQIASDFSKFAKPLEQKFQPVEINELLRSVSELYEPEKKLVMKKQLHTGELWVEGVKDELRRVLINLVKNAYEAMPKAKGTITLKSEIADEGKVVKILVIDDGEGIPKEYQPRIFIPNFSTKSSGTGLGLAITKKIIEEHGGEITFASEAGKGTTFEIRLPVVEE